MAKAANAFGLFDTHGNVSEWCLDGWHNNYNGAPAHGGSWERDAAGGARVARGGSWGDGAYKCRSAFRHRLKAPDRLVTLGFRVAISSPPDARRR